MKKLKENEIYVINTKDLLGLQVSKINKANKTYSKFYKHAFKTKNLKIKNNFPILGTYEEGYILPIFSNYYIKVLTNFQEETSYGYKEDFVKKLNKIKSSPLAIKKENIKNLEELTDKEKKQILKERKRKDERYQEYNEIVQKAKEKLLKSLDELNTKEKPNKSQKIDEKFKTYIHTIKK